MVGVYVSMKVSQSRGRDYYLKQWNSTRRSQVLFTASTNTTYTIYPKKTQKTSYYLYVQSFLILHKTNYFCNEYVHYVHTVEQERELK